MTVVNLKEILFEELDYTEGSGLEDAASLRGRPIPYIDQVYFIRDIPVAYFSQLKDYNPDELWMLHRQVWSQSRVPLLYVILPTEIRVYNSYAEPAEKAEELDVSDRLLHHLQQLVDEETARQEIRYRLVDSYKRLSLETGAFWSTPDGQRIKRESRADQRLLNSMEQVRLRLSDLPNDQAYALLGRSIFIRYLEDRDILTPQWISETTAGQAESYLEALSKPGTDTAYLLFEALSQRFNGDLFPPDRERDKVKGGHLTLIRQFLEGYDFDSSQMSFWPYDFTYIPIELISGIYDTFLYGKQDNDSDKDSDDEDNSDDEIASRERRRRALGAYYTPLSLVDFIVEETLPLETTRLGMIILDPACGSGVFLVRAYQCLVEIWKQQNNSFPTMQVLSGILKESIFGVDIERNAVQIAAFSLYLAMLDYLTNEEIMQEHFRFPSLKDTNLISADFFSEEVDMLFANKHFDRIIGNLPWGRGTLTKAALHWLEKRGYQVAGKQIVQAFLLRVPEFCAEEGEMALLAGAKSTILVASNTYEEFRRLFFERYHVRAVVNFSALVYELFDESISPAIVLFYQSRSPIMQSKLVYGVPKPSSLSQRLGAIILDATEVKYLDREELLASPVLWKVASWGNPRDAGLIQRLRSFQTLRELEKTELLRGEIVEGFFEGKKESRKKDALWLQGKPFLATRKFKPYYIAEVKETVHSSRFERPRTEEIYHGPLALIRRSICQAAFFDGDFIAYRDKITGILGWAGQEDLLKWLVAYINSPLARYYHFLTSTSWAVERGTIIHNEYKDMPFLVPEEGDSRFKEVIDHFNQIIHLHTQSSKVIMRNVKAEIRDHEFAIAELIFDLYGLHPAERQLVWDVVQYEIEFFKWAKRDTRSFNDSKSHPVRHPDSIMFIEYAQTFTETVTTLLRYQAQTLNAVVYQDGAPLSVVGFELVSLADAKEVHVIDSSLSLRDILRKLDRLLLEQHTPTLYMRRHVRIYEAPWLYLVRPSERRFWTRSQARADADSFIEESLSRSRAKMRVSN